MKQNLTFRFKGHVWVLGEIAVPSFSDEAVAVLRTAFPGRDPNASALRCRCWQYLGEHGQIIVVQNGSGVSVIMKCGLANFIIPALEGDAHDGLARLAEIATEYGITPQDLLASLGKRK